MPEFYHSVTLDEEKCVGCTNCIKRCPTEAIRVRAGKARVYERLENVSAAIREYRAVIALDKNDARAYGRLAAPSLFH